MLLIVYVQSIITTNQEPVNPINTTKNNSDSKQSIVRLMTPNLTPPLETFIVSSPNTTIPK